MRAGVVASTVANYAGKARADEAEPAQPRDFLQFTSGAGDRDPDPVEHFKGQ